MLLPLVTTSCFKMEEEDLFDKAASQRLDESAADYAKFLTEKGGKWKMEYFATEEMEGYVYIMDFQPNGYVQISGMNDYIRTIKGYTGSQPNQSDEEKAKEQWGSAQSMWDIITDNGPVLSFNSYNPYFHLFSTPEDFTSGGSSNSTLSGRGFEGDYEFTLLRKSAAGDSLFLSGKKREIEIIMTRMPEETDNYAYLNQVRKNVSNLFRSSIPRVFIDFGDGDRYVMLNASTLVPTLYDEKAKDALTEQFSRNTIVCYDSYAFMKPLEFNETQKIVQFFVQQADGSLLCSDDNKTTISAGDLGKDCYADTMQTWTVDPVSLTGEMKSLYETIAAKMPWGKDNKGRKVQAKIKNLEFSYLHYPVNQHIMKVVIEVKQGTVAYLIFHYTPSFPGTHQIQFDLTQFEEDEVAQVYWNNIPELQELINLILGTPMQLSAASMLAPTPMTVTSTKNSENSFVATATYIP